MVRLNFNNSGDFERLFKKKDLQVTRTIIEGIEEAFRKDKRTAQLFEITFADYEQAFEISLPKSQWEVSLQSCLDHLHELALADEQIDCWKLLEAIKKLK